MSKWFGVYYDCFNDETGKHHVAVTFDTKEDANEFVRLSNICKDVNDELLFYGDGVLRTIEKKGKRSARKTKTSKKVL